MRQLVYLIENRARGMVAGVRDTWKVDDSSPIMTSPQMAERQASEWNDDFPHLEHRASPFIPAWIPKEMR